MVGGTPETPVVAGGAQVAPAVGGAPVLEEKEEDGNVVELSEEQISQVTYFLRAWVYRYVISGFSLALPPG